MQFSSSNLLDKFVVLYKRVALAADLAAHLDGAVGSLLTVEDIAMIQFHFINTVKSPHKIQMPIAAAEFTVSDGVITSALLLFDEAGNLLVFYSGQCGMIDLTGLELGTCLFQVLGAKEAAHKIVTERRFQLCHIVKPSLYVNFQCSSLDGNSISHKWVCVKYERMTV